jgi:hypothetical protein
VRELEVRAAAAEEAAAAQRKAEEEVSALLSQVTQLQVRLALLLALLLDLLLALLLARDNRAFTEPQYVYINTYIYIYIS